MSPLTPSSCRGCWNVVPADYKEFQHAKLKGMRGISVFQTAALGVATILLGCVPLEHMPPGPSADSSVQCRHLDGSLWNAATGRAESTTGIGVYIFVGTKCPIANRYAPEIKRIRDLCLDEGHRLTVVYPDPEALLVELQQHAADYGYSEFAIWDDRQQLADKIKAGYTPEAVVVVGTSQNPFAKVIYRGRINDWYVDFGKSKAAAEVHDLRTVLAELANSKEIPYRETKVVGCLIPRLGVTQP